METKRACTGYFSLPESWHSSKMSTNALATPLSSMCAAAESALASRRTLLMPPFLKMRSSDSKSINAWSTELFPAALLFNFMPLSEQTRKKERWAMYKGEGHT